MSKVEDASKRIAWYYHFLPPFVLTCITALTYYPSLHYSFQFDDIANIQKHFFIRHHQLSKLFFSGSRWISYWLNALHYSIGRFDPFSFRLGNLIIHSMNGVLIFFIILFALLHSYGNNFYKRNAHLIATIAAMLFLLHPVQTQTVSYVIQGQLEGLACMFILAMALTFLHFCYNPSATQRAFLLFLFFVLAVVSCGTKEIAFISPFLIMLVDWFFVAHASWRSFKQRLWIHALFFITITSMYVYFLKPTFFTDILCLKMVVNNNIGNIITEKPSQTIGPWIFFISQFKVILHYIWIFIWPFNISVEYDWVLVRHFFAWDCFFPLLLLLTVAIAICRILLTNPTHPLCFGALWFFMCIAPRSSIIPSPELLVDYKTYTASIGWLLIIACALAALIEYMVIRKMMRKWQAQAFAILLCAFSLGYLTWQRNLVWSSGTEFWMNIIRNAPGKARAYNNYGVELSQIYKRYEEAIPYFRKAAQMDCNYPDPLNNLAVCYSHLNRIDDAIEALKQGLRINRYYPEGYNNLASFYIQQGKFNEAQECLNQALELRPHYGKAYFNLGRMYIALKDEHKALENFKKACTIADLDNEFGYKIYGQAALNQHVLPEAIWAFNKAIECNPTEPEALFGLANAYYLSEQYDQAMTIYKRVVVQTPGDIRAWYNLGETYFMQEKIIEALNCFKRVEPQGDKMPQVHIKMAACYEKLHQPDIAYEKLQKACNTPSTPAILKVKARELLAHLENQHPQLKVAALMG